MTEEDYVNGMDHSPGIMVQTDIMSPGSNISNGNDKATSPGIIELPSGISKYAQLLSIIEEMSKDIRPTYAGSKANTERLKKGIGNARTLVRECLMETEKSAQLQQWFIILTYLILNIYDAGRFVPVSAYLIFYEMFILLILISDVLFDLIL